MIDERSHYLIPQRHGRPPQIFRHCHMWWVMSLPSVCIARTNTHPGNVCNKALSNALYDRATWPFSSIMTTSYVVCPFRHQKKKNNYRKRLIISGLTVTSLVLSFLSFFLKPAPLPPSQRDTLPPLLPYLWAGSVS